MTTEEITADIISFIRQQALRDALVNHEDHIKHTIAKVKVNNSEMMESHKYQSNIDGIKQVLILLGFAAERLWMTEHGQNY